MIKIDKLTIKNFMSVGAIAQVLDFGQSGLALVLGENLDMGGAGSRNGVGKTTIVNSLCYALYGQAVSSIRKDNLINTVNKKNMVVSLEFEKDGTRYKIERGRKPNFFKFWCNDQTVGEESSDEAQGENKETQREIDRILGLSWTMFRQIVCLNTYTEPFLMMGAGRQREIIEELLGITQLSQKAENLKELIKVTKASIEREEFQIQTIKSSNQRILSAISDLQTKIDQWNQQNQEEQNSLADAVAKLMDLDIESEIDCHKNNQTRQELIRERDHQQRILAQTKQRLTALNRQLDSAALQLSSLEAHECPMCGQGVHDQKQKELVNSLKQNQNELQLEASSLKDAENQAQMSLIMHNQALDQLKQCSTIYSSIDAAYEHKNSLKELQSALERAVNATNPYHSQLGSLNNTLQNISYDELNSLTSLKEHQEFLLKLLSNKDSFIRKRIIDQNLAYLNHRLNDYLHTLGISHQVKFQNDLSVDIQYQANSMDFPQLSRGESTRVILALSWAFRDIWENANTGINLLFVDELLDSGLDSVGLERAMEVLKTMSRDRGKNVYLISHREDLMSRCENILAVIKEDGFSRLDWDYFDR
jgi:DNA repair exonuclease SbcCD ATPase subunit